MQWIYLDNNATTAPEPEVTAAMQEAHEALWANPSSVHRFGQMVRHRVELARASVAKLLNCRDRELVFTSGGTEANNLALAGVLRQAEAGSGASPDGEPVPRVLITSPIEHSAVREPAEALQREGIQEVHTPLDASGRMDPAGFEATLQRVLQEQPEARVLVSLQWANNETGIIQPIPEVVEAVQRERRARRARLLLHVDATQMVGKLPVDVEEVAVDLLTLAGHKFHGPKGIGALYIRSGVRLRATQRGGPQERERRGGTENTPGIIGVGVAAEQATAFVHDTRRIQELSSLRDQLESGLLAAVPEAQVNGVRPLGAVGAEPNPRLWNTTNIGFPHLEAEAILLGLSQRGVCASAGAACSSGSLEPSPVLRAMGVPEAVAHGSVRLSLSRQTRVWEVEQAVAIIPEVVRQLGQTLPGRGAAVSR